MRETTLHKDLKGLYLREGGQEETWVDGFLIDIVKDDLLIEIQTQNFSALKRKLNKLLEYHPIRIVYPIAQEKWIILKDSQGNVLWRRRSPKKGKVVHIFYELVYISKWVAHPNFSLEILLTSEEEERSRDGQGSWRRKGVSIHDRRLITVHEHHLFNNPADYRHFLPSDFLFPCSNHKIANQLSIPYGLAAKMTYSLLQMGIIEIQCKKHNTNLFRLASENK